MKKLTLTPAALCLLLLFTTAASAQLVSWQDLIDGELPEPDHRITYGADSLQSGELWLPEETPRATVILYHGGCWQGIYPGVEIMNHMAYALRNDGFAVWNTGYRRLGDEGGGYPGTFKDAATGADYLREIRREFDLGEGPVIAAGHSAGGHLAAWTALRRNLPDSSPLKTIDPIEIDGVISLAGINDLERYARYGASSCGSDTVPQLVNADKREKDPYRDTSPLHLLPFDVPYIEISAAFDAPVPPFMGFHFVNAALEAGDHAEHILQESAGHFEMIAPWSSEWEEVISLFRTLSDQ
ncbi:MAG: alpha/beta hydrolase [Balneolaceae bacterium]|nr:alpha/beta hydrolase [Balneolaceae bacterium]MCH8548958.1 alpha/beta hydrolase [Balneolaceae bacterium]